MVRSSRIRVLIFICVPVFIAVTVITALYMISNAAAYDNIKVFEISGNVQVQREGEKNIEIYENMNLTSGDKIIVNPDSYLTLKLDDDKYARVEENTVVTVKGESHGLSSNYTLSLDKGAVTTEIQNKLDENSTYQVSTPNSTMSVRGTVFRVEVASDTNDDNVSQLQVFEGIVSIDTADDEDDAYIQKGSSAWVAGTEKTKVIYSANVDFSKLSDETLLFLLKAERDGKDLCVNGDEIEAMLDSRGIVVPAETQPSDTISNVQTEATDAGAVNQNDNKAESQITETLVTEIGAVENATVSEPKSNNESSETKGAVNNDTKILNKTTDAVVQPSSTVKPQASATTVVETTAPTVEPEKETTINTAVIYSVTFVFPDITFPTQCYLGQCVSEMSISGSDYNIDGWYTDSSYTNKWDFKTPITSDISLYAKTN